MLEFLKETGKLLLNWIATSGILLFIILFFFKQKTINFFNKKLVVFSKLHDDRALVIKELYSNLVDVEDQEKKIFELHNNSNNQKKKKLKRQFQIYHQRFARYHRRHKIYFDDDTNKKIDNIIEVLLKAGVSEYADKKKLEEKLNWKNLERKKLIEEFQKLKEDLKKMLQKLLGV